MTLPEYWALLCVQQKQCFHPVIASFLSDFACSRQTLHDLLCAGDLSGLLLPGELDLGCGGHGLRRAEPGDHRGGSAEGGGVPGYARAAEEATGGSTGRTI